MEPSSGIKTWQWVVTIIVIIVLIIIGIMVFGDKGTPDTTGTESPTPTATTGIAALNRITMTDQYPGNVVYLSSVQLASRGWVAIQTDDNGKPGTVIGSARFESGINPGKITLTQPMLDGGTYYAVIYKDAGSETFSITGNEPLTDENGNIILRVFRASTSVGPGLKG